MEIIKPSGRSFVDKTDKTKRKIRKNNTEKNNADCKNNAENNADITIAELMAEDMLLLRQWIGVIDKIFPKPKNVNKPKEGQKNAARQAPQEAKQKEAYEEAQNLLKNRELLGRAAWHFLLKNNRFKKPTDMELLWQRKLTTTQKKAPREDKGRWHKAFIGNNNFAENVVKRIDAHLMQQSRSIYGEEELKRVGLSAHRGRAIARNTPYNAAAAHEKKAQKFVSEGEWEAYAAKAGDVAKAIHDTVLAVWKEQTQEEKRQEKGYKTPAFNIAVEVLKKQVWSRLFGDNAGSFAAAEQQDRVLLQTHLAVKETYKRLLKGHKRLDNAKLSRILPEDNGALFRLLCNKKQNQDLGHLIRLGKIIHYEASLKETAEGDKTAFIIKDWPSKEEVENSDFWTSAWQTKIKQNEALVRVWRRALAFAARGLKTLTDTVKKVEDGDILSKQKDILEAYTEGNDYADFDKKYQLLFSDNPEEKIGIPRTAEERKTVVEFCLSSLEALRNAAFHFKGMGTFIAALQEGEKTLPQSAQLYQTAQAYYQQQLKAVMEAAFFHKFFSNGQIGKIWESVNAPVSAALPLPRLKRVLERAEDAWKEQEKLALPQYSTAEARQGGEENAHWLNCQYTALKLLYDKPFNAWFAVLPHEKLQTYIDKAIARSTAAAKKLNGKEDKYEALIAAKAGGLEKLKAGEQADSFFSKLIAATATEFRVQNGYSSNGDNAKKQAEYIEKFKCDIVALALADYLPTIIENIELFCGDTRAPAESNAPYKPQAEATASAGAPWQQKLYLLLHFMPVEEANSLCHQLKKWQVVTQAEKMAGERVNGAAEQELLVKTLEVFDLYMALHDAQFMVAGKEGKQLSELLAADYKEYFTNPEDFDEVFKKQGEQENPQAFRGLREMQRFGGEILKYLSDKKPPEIPPQYKVKHDSVAKWRDTEKSKAIVAAQQERIDLHEAWGAEKNKKQDKQWLKVNGQHYAELVRNISEHQQLTAEVMLQNPVRLHRLLMNVLGRLADFAGLFERDVYFTLLALLYKKGVTKEDIIAQFKDRGAFLEKGNYKALWQLKDTGIKDRIIQDFFGLFDKEIQAKKLPTCIRNDFAHFKMLQQGKPPMLQVSRLPVNLTAEVNKARQLMAYDRKLKNAVSKSIIKMLDKEGLSKEKRNKEGVELQWKMQNHELAQFKASAKPIKHFGGAKVIDKKQNGVVVKNKNGDTIQVPITEPRHGQAYVKMVRALFGAKP